MRAKPRKQNVCKADWLIRSTWDLHCRHSQMECPPSSVKQANSIKFAWSVVELNFKIFQVCTNYIKLLLKYSNAMTLGKGMQSQASILDCFCSCVMPKQFWLRGFVYTSYFKEEDIPWTFETVGVALSRYPFKWIFYSEVLGRFKQWPMCFRRDPLYITKTTWPCATIYVLYFAHTVCFVPTNRTVHINPSRNPSWLITVHSSKQMWMLDFISSHGLWPKPLDSEAWASIQL